MKMETEALKNDCFHLVGFLLSSAHGLYNEPPDYGIYRLMDAAERLLALLDAHGLGDEFTLTLQQRLADEKAASMDADRQKAVLNQAVMDYSQELLRRLSAG